MVLQLNQPSSMRVLPRDGGRRQGVTKVRAHSALDTFKQRPAEGQCGEPDAPKKLVRNGRSPRQPSPKESETVLDLARHQGRSPRKPSPKTSGTAFELAMWTRNHVQVRTSLASRRQARRTECHTAQFSSDILDRVIHPTGQRSRGGNRVPGFTAAFAACLLILSVMIALVSPPFLPHGHS